MRMATVAAVVTAQMAVALIATPLPRANALPAGFPDLDAFAAAPAGPYTIGRGLSGDQIEFLTSFNVGCSIRVGPALTGAKAQPAECNGDIPGMASVPDEPMIAGTTRTAGPGDCVVGDAKPVDWASRADYALSRYWYFCHGEAVHPIAGVTVLPAGQKLSSGHVTCVVGAPKLIACLDTTEGEHGFLLQPTGSIAF